MIMPTTLVGTDRRADVLHRRAISDEVIDHVVDGVPRYAEFERGDSETFVQSHSHPERWHRRLVSQSGGLIVNRWGIDSHMLPSYIRFDDPVITDYRMYRRDGSLRTSRYIYRSAGEMCDDGPKRIDVHPRARSVLASSPTPHIYFCLEGSLKADALLSSGRAAVSVPSVTLWEVPEEHLRPYLDLLRQAPEVFVVPDSDYLAMPGSWEEAGRAPEFINALVRHQTDRAVRWLREHGVRAVYLVPPYLSPDEALKRGVSDADRLKVGIDDHLAWGGDLRSWDSSSPTLGVHIWRPPEPEVPMWLPPHPAHVPRRDRDHRDRELLDWLMVNHGRFGVFSPGDATLDLRWSRDKVQDACRSLEARGSLRIWEGKPIVTANGAYVNKPHLFRILAPGLEQAEVRAA